MRTAIFGAGSMGTILGAYITKNGGRVDLINHNREHIAVLRERGAHITGNVDFIQPVVAYTDDMMSGHYDIFFLTTKQLNNDQVVRYLKGFLAEDGVIVALQDGIPELGIEQIVGPDHVLGCTIAWGATMKGPGVCELTSSTDALTFQLGSLSPYPNKHIQDVKNLLGLMGPVIMDPNFIGTRWSKLLINASFSGLSTVLGSTFGEAILNHRSRKIVQALIKECIDVCDKAGIQFARIQNKDIVKLLDYHTKLKKLFSFWVLPLTMRKHFQLKASMLQDIEQGRKTEVDAINGVVSSEGRKVGCPTPMNDRVVELIHKIENGELKACFDNIKYFE